MQSVFLWVKRSFALVLVSALAACGQETPEVQTEAAADEQPAEQPAEQAQPQGDAISRRGNEIFVAEDPDDFSPGIPVGEIFPDIRARFEGAEITSIDRFIMDRGAIFIAVRSVDW